MSLIRVDLPHARQLPVAHYAVAPNSHAGSTKSAPNDQARYTEGPSPVISVVIPAKNEASSLPVLLAEVVGTLCTLKYTDPITETIQAVTFEVIVIDDGSRDGSNKLLARLAAEYPTLRPLYLSLSVGQSSCLIAGIRQARGTWIATLDADLQNHPADLKLLWEALAGYDVALGWRVKRAGSWSKRIISWLANRARNAALGQAIQDTGCAVRIFPRHYALHLPAFRGMHRFIGPLLLREGCRIVQVPVRDRPRIHGESHYGFWNRSWNVLVDLLGVIWLMHRPVLHEPYEAHQRASHGVPTAWPTPQSSPATANTGPTGKAQQPEAKTTC